MKSVKKNYIFNTLYQLFNLLVPLITAPYISRVLGASGIGIVSYTNSISSVFCIFAVLGTSIYGQQVIAQCRDDVLQRSKSFLEIELICVVTTSLTLVSWFIFIEGVNEYRIYYFILSFNLIAIGLDISWFFAGLEDFSIIVFRSLIMKCFTIVLIIAFVKKESDLIWYFVIQSLGGTIANILLWIPLKSRVVKVLFKELTFKKHIQKTMVYFVPTIAASVYSYMDKTMIGILTRSSEENGYYDQAQRIINMAYTVVASLNTVMSSRIAYLFAKKKNDEILKKLKDSSDFIAILTYPISFGLMAIADTFIPWFYGPGYERVILLLKIASPLVILLSVHNYLAAQYLVPSGQRGKSTWGVIVGAAINFCMNSILIPAFSSVGALIATIISELIICTIYFVMSKKYISFMIFLKSSKYPCLASIIMAIIVYIVGLNENVGVIVVLSQVFVGVFTYYVLLLLFKVRMVEEYSIIILNKLIKLVK